MVGRTVVIGDPCPWVAQSAEAFLGKIFACSYSIAGLNVLSGNPADHLVHRHTHRVVRGSLFVCGRPDGRLTALTTLEASTCLAVNQASSIQSIGGTCESITIGHNMSKLPLSYKGIFLESCRPRFLCEKLLDDADEEDMAQSGSPNKKVMQLTATGNLKTDRTSFVDSDVQTQRELPERAVKSRKSGMSFRKRKSDTSGNDELNTSRRGSIFGSKRKLAKDEEMDKSRHRSSASLLGEIFSLRHNYR